MLPSLFLRDLKNLNIGDMIVGKLVIEKHAGRIGEAKIDHLPKSTFGLGHTRWATHGGVTDINAHPHLDCTGKIAIIHNGIIENYDKIKEKLVKIGHKFVSETDSEVAAHLIEEYCKRFPFSGAVRLAFSEFTGLNAIIAMNSQTFEFVAAKTGSPLVIGFGRGENFLASDAPALLSHTRQVHFLEDGELVKVTSDKVELFDVKTGKRKKFKLQTLNWKVEEADKGKYPHFMIKEIMEQAKVLRGISQNAASQIPDLAKIIKKAYGTYMVGCGTASYAALSGTYLFSRIAHRHVNFAPGSEFGYLVDFLTPKSLVIAFSQSGETIDIIESVGKAKAKGAKVLAIVNNLGSTLYRMADYKMLLGAGPEKCVLSTKTFTAKLAIVLLLARALNTGLGEGKQLLEKAIREVEIISRPASLTRIKKLASKIVNNEHIYVIGRGQSYPIALEAALKIKEVSYIHAEGFAAGELKHGVIALVEKGTPCLVFAPNDETYGAVLSGAMEMKARGGYIIGVSWRNHEVFDWHIPVSDCGDASAIPNVVVAQLLGYFLCLKKGYDPDKPRNLAKSVTVR
ncbi:MAG: glucosamine--fructose-6-phosphate aminotransferase (isomerizing) [Microgenomates group bacterium LiPW_16]|nr:MAG: glucosamine--fructose-6-phosphate aminotransferase (isomerizing) [Microgenomates group bacterium LiPW_16]